MTRKYKRHTPLREVELRNRLTDELGSTADFRSKVLTMHLFIEYWLNEMLCAVFSFPEKIIDHNILGEFQNKVTILQSLNIIANENLLNNIKQIQEIRNQYVHPPLRSAVDIDDSILQRIKKLAKLNTKSKLPDTIEPEQKFLTLGVQTFEALLKLSDLVDYQWPDSDFRPPTN